MNSRAARILVPLAVELAFALVVGIIIVATDGGRYGLGAKAVLDDFLNTYGRATAYEATVVDLPGQYRDIWGNGESPTTVRRFIQLYFLAPDRYAVLERTLGGESLCTQIGAEGTLTLSGSDGTVQTVDVVRPLGRDAAWPPPVVYGLLRDKRGAVYIHRKGTEVDELKPMRMGDLGGFRLLREATYVEVEKRPRPYHEPSLVITIWQNHRWRELWVDGETLGLFACVILQDDDVHTEHYIGTRFDRPIDAAVFEGGEAGLERLKQWTAERESAPTN